MPIDVDTAGSPGWWLDRLAKKLLDRGRLERLDALDAWFRGDPPLPDVRVDAATRRAYEAFQRKCRSNFAELVVEAPRERMRPVGLRTSADGDETGDADAWRIWTRAGLEVESAEVHRTMLALGDAYVIVGDVDDESGVPVITAEDPRQVVSEHDPLQQRRIVAAAKLFHDDIAELDLAYLYLPGRVFVASREQKRSGRLTWSAKAFDWDADRGGAEGTVLPAGLMPVVRFRNARGVGEFETHVDLLGRINHMLLQRVMIATLQAFRQRAVKGLPSTYPVGHAQAGQQIDYTDIFSADPGALWQVPEGVEFWESGQSDLTPILASVRADVEHLAAVTRTPMHYLQPGGENQSAEGAALSREGLVFKVEDRIARANAGWSQVMATAFRWLDDPRADLNALQVMWAAPERYSLAERYSAATQANAAGVPWRTRMTDIAGFPPDQVDRMESERADDALLAPAVTEQQRQTPAAVPVAEAPPVPAGG